MRALNIQINIQKYAWIFKKNFFLNIYLNIQLFEYSFCEKIFKNVLNIQDIYEYSWYSSGYDPQMPRHRANAHGLNCRVQAHDLRYIAQAHHLRCSAWFFAWIKSSGSGCSNLVQRACLRRLTGAGRCNLQGGYHSEESRSIKRVVCMGEDSWD